MIYKDEYPGQIYTYTSGYLNLIFRARMLWRDMATWLTIYMFSVFGGYGNQKEISDKLYQVPLEYGNVMRLIFGDKLSEDYITLLSNYIIILEYLFQAQMAGDTAAVDEYTKQLYENIDKRAAFLAQINPYWQEGIWKTLLYTFNKMIIEDATTLLSKDYQKNIDVFDSLLTQSSIIGDYFSEGILNYLYTKPA